MNRYILMNYAVQCRDELSGETGSFIFDVEKYAQTGKLFAVSPVYPDLVELYGNTSPDERKSCFVEYLD